MRTTEEDLEEVEEETKKDWFEEGGCSESSKVERWNVNNCRRNRVNLAIFIKGTIPDKN